MKKTTQFAILLVLIIVVAVAGVGYWTFWHARQAADTAATREETKVLPEIPRKTAEWNTYHGSNALTGVADATLPEKLGILWRFKAGAPVYQPPVLYGERVFVATDRGEIIAVDFSGQRVWSKELFTGEDNKGTPVRERIDSPIACFNGLIFVGTMRGVLYAIDVTSGAEKWRAQIGSPPKGTANYLGADGGGRVYVVGSADGVLHCLDADSGAILWRTEGVERCDGSPAVSANAVVFGSCAAALHVFSPQVAGPPRNIELGEDSQVAGGVALDGDWVVSGCRSGKMIQADTKTGQTAWVNTDNTSEVFTTPAITTEWVVIAADDGIVYGLERPTGKQRWRFETKGRPSSPVIANDKVVLAADGRLIVLRLADGVSLLTLEISDEITSPAVIQDRVFVGSADGTLVALGPQEEQGGGPTP